jgi:hypothetical protein
MWRNEQPPIINVSTKRISRHIVKQILMVTFIGWTECILVFFGVVYIVVFDLETYTFYFFGLNIVPFLVVNFAFPFVLVFLETTFS